MFQERYRALHEKDAPTEAMIADTVQRAARCEARRRPVWKRGLCAVAAAACVLVGLPLAAASDTGYQLMRAVAPSAAQFFTPVRRTDEDQGIRMEVESAYIHGDTAEIYVSFQDLEGDRIDASTDLYDSYSINRPFSSAGGCIPQGFDEETGKARFLLLITEWENQRIEGKKITFSVRELLCGKQTYDDIAIPIDLAAVGKAEAVTEEEIVGGNVPEGYDWRSTEPYRMQVLEPDEPWDGFPVDGIALTGAGWIGGKLHLQTTVTDPEACDNHGFFTLRDSVGNEAEPPQMYYFRPDPDDWERQYLEYVFDVTPEEAAQYQLFGWFQTGGTLITGNWRITFPLENAEP